MLERDAPELHIAFDLLNLIPTQSNPTFDLRARSLQLRIQFDALLAKKEDLDNILTLARNFERYLKNNKTYSKSKITSYLNFIRFYKRIARLYNQPGSKLTAMQDILEDLAADKQVILRHWLKEKAEAYVMPPPDISSKP